jgi:PhnB protein
MRLEPYVSLRFDGRCEAAFEFYERYLGGNILFKLTWGDSPLAKSAPAEWGGKILYARLAIGDTALLGADALPNTYERPRGFAVLLEAGDQADVERVFQALAENGTVHMPLQETFWALRYGILTDQFGIPWEIHCGKPQ